MRNLVLLTGLCFALPLMAQQAPPATPPPATPPAPKPPRLKSLAWLNLSRSPPPKLQQRPSRPSRQLNPPPSLQI